ncbi:hypothetical protein WJX72_000753 [[Myrmecia] bisecta]|uniref:DNA helicase n=1 Tax=[Myrmecia] bisecta TaxID=41462 RepID=A0AAW1PS12_9CHLO
MPSRRSLFACALGWAVRLCCPQALGCHPHGGILFPLSAVRHASSLLWQGLDIPSALRLSSHGSFCSAIRVLPWCLYPSCGGQRTSSKGRNGSFADLHTNTSPFTFLPLWSMSPFVPEEELLPSSPQATCKLQGKQMLLCTSTGAAAADIIMIDELSMMTSSMLDIIMRRLQPVPPSLDIPLALK